MAGVYVAAGIVILLVVEVGGASVPAGVLELLLVLLPIAIAAGLSFAVRWRRRS